MNKVEFQKVLLKFASEFPEGNFKSFLRINKNKIKCILYNRSQTDFKVEYNNNCFNFIFKNFEIKYKEDCFYEIKAPLRGYLKQYKIKPGDIIVDAGAYIGAFAIYAAKLVGHKGKIIAFEPDPDSYQKLLTNIKLNNLDNITVIKKGLWKNSAKLEFYNDQGAGSSFVYDSKENSKPLILSVVRLDEELSKLGISKVNFIKMDVEGAELEIIKSLTKWLINQDISLAIASYHEIDNKQTFLALEDIFNNIGFKVSTSFQEHLTTYASNK